MSSAVLYLAIVAVWGIVLVPMWLRRDGDGIGRLLHRRHEIADHLDEVAEPAHDEDDAAFEEPGEPEFPSPAYLEPVGPEPVRQESVRLESVRLEPVRRRRVTRGAVMARRRRRTLGLGLLTVTAVTVAAFQVAPWWFVVPPVVLLGGHLSLLRVAVRMDHARSQELRRVAAIRAAQARRAREEHEAQEAAEAATRTAEVIELPGLAREEVYDQYTDRRAVGD
jgi:hypothetical protein